MKKRLTILMLFFVHFYANAQNLWSQSGYGSTAIIQVDPKGNPYVIDQGKLCFLNSADGKIIWDTPILPNATVTPLNDKLVMISWTNKVQLRNIENGKILFENGTEYDKCIFITLHNKPCIIAKNDDTSDLLEINLTNGQLKKTQIFNYRANPILPVQDSIYTVFFGNKEAAIFKNLSPIAKVENVGIQSPSVKVLNNHLILTSADIFLCDLNGEVKTKIEMPKQQYMLRSWDVKAHDNKFYIAYYKDKKPIITAYDAVTGKELVTKILEKRLMDYTFFNNKIYYLQVGGMAVTGELIQADPTTLEIDAEQPIKQKGIYKMTVFLNHLFLEKLGSVICYKEGSLAKIEDNVYNPNEDSAILKENTAYFFKKNRLYQFNDKGCSMLSTADVKIKLIEEEKITLEKVNDGVIIHGIQSIAKIDFSGKEIFNKYYAPPGQSTGSILGRVAVVAASAYLGEVAQQNANATTTTMSRTGYLTDKAAYNQIGSEFGSDVWKKYSKSYKAANYKAMVTKADGDFKIIKVSKTTGEIIGEATVKDRNPNYVLDADGIKVYISENNTIKATKI